MAAIMPSAYRLDKKLTPHPFLIRDEDGKVLTKNLGFIFEGRKSIYSVFHSTKDRHLHLEQPKVFGCKVKLADGIILIIQDGVKIHANLDEVEHSKLLGLAETALATLWAEREPLEPAKARKKHHDAVYALVEAILKGWQRYTGSDDEPSSFLVWDDDEFAW